MAVERANWDNMSFGKIAHLINGRRGRKAERENNSDGGMWSAGQGIGLIEDTPTCQEAMDRLICEAEVVVQQRLAGLLTPAAKL